MRKLSARALAKAQRTARQLPRRAEYRALSHALRRVSIPPDAETVVEAGISPPPGARTLVLGDNPRDDRITLLADVREQGSLPAGRFAIVVLRSAATEPRAPVVVENVARSLRPGGVLLTLGSTQADALLRSRFETLSVRRIGPYRIVNARRSAGTVPGPSA